MKLKKADKNATIKGKQTKRKERVGKMKIKEMNYSKGNDRTILILAKGKEKGFNWFVVSYGTHPCSYVGLPKEHKYYGKGYDDIPVECHCGLTFAADDFMFNPVEIDCWWIGWDYAHSGDFASYYEKDTYLGKNSKKWTTDELIKEVMEVIGQLNITEGNKDG